MKLEELYQKIPKSTCKEGCSSCCSNSIQFTPSEYKAMGGYTFDTKQMICSHLIDGKCYDMFKDVYYLLINNLNDIPLDKLYEMSLEYGILPYVFYILYYTGQLFDNAILKQYAQKTRGMNMSPQTEHCGRRD